MADVIKVTPESPIPEVFDLASRPRFKVTDPEEEAFSIVSGFDTDASHESHLNPIFDPVQFARGALLEMEVWPSRPLPFKSIIGNVFAAIDRDDLWQLCFHLESLPFPLCEIPANKGLESANIEKINFIVTPSIPDMILPIARDSGILLSVLANTVGVPTEGGGYAYLGNPLLRPYRVSMECEWGYRALGTACSVITNTLILSGYRAGLNLYIERDAVNGA